MAVAEGLLPGAVPPVLREQVSVSNNALESSSYLSAASAGIDWCSCYSYRAATTIDAEYETLEQRRWKLRC